MTKIINFNEIQNNKKRDKLIKELELIDYEIMTLLKNIDKNDDEEVIQKCKDRLYENCTLIINEVLGEEESKNFSFMLKIDIDKYEFEFYIFYKGKAVMSRNSNIYTHGEKVFMAYENKSYILK